MTGIVLGIDLGGSKLALALGTPEGRVLARSRRPTEPSGDPKRDIARILESARALLAEAGISADQLDAVGISVPGPADAASGRVLGPANLPGWRDVPVGAELRAALGCPVRMENDANAAALAEWRFGAAAGFQNAVYLTMSTGVGGGIVLNGALYRGHEGHAGELGHVPVEWEGERCACGQQGCLEAYVGGRSLTARLRASTPATSLAAELAGGREHVTPEYLLAAAREGDAFAMEEMARFNHYLARGIVMLAFSLAPEVVVLGTIASAAGEALCLGPVREQVQERVWPRIARSLRIECSALGEELPYRAALCAALEGEPVEAAER
ncbi:MAG: ROK family protein [Myxococcota bacterium]